MVVLLQEIPQHFPVRLTDFLIQEKAVPAQDLSAADEEHLDADSAVIHGQPHHIPVAAFGGSLLFFRQFPEAQQRIPVPGRRLEFQVVRSLLHLGGEIFFQLGHLPVQEQQDGIHHLPIFTDRHLPRTGGQAPVEMVLETGPFGVHVPAVAQGEHGPDQFHGVPEGSRIGKGPVIPGPVLQHPPSKHHPRVGFPYGDLQIGICLVILQIDVVPGPVLFDQVALQDQGFHLTGGDNGFNGSHMGVDGPDLGGHLAGRAEITAHPVLQDHRLPHIDHLAGGIVHDVDPRGVGQHRQGLFDGIVHSSTFFTYWPV